MTLPTPRTPETVRILLQIGVLIVERDWVGNGVVIIDVIPLRVAVLRGQPSVHQPFFIVHVFSLRLIWVTFSIFIYPTFGLSSLGSSSVRLRFDAGDG